MRKTNTKKAGARSPDWRFWGLAAIILVAVFLAYGPALQAGFIWDDDDYVTHNPVLRSFGGLLRIWAEPTSLPQYYPLVHTTYWIEYHLWGLDPFGYHFVNVSLHAVNAVLLFVVLRRLKVPAALFAATVFALHPVHVESVAWITERKNTLSGVFFLLALLAWLRWRPLDAASETRQGPTRHYWAAFTAFCAALLSKTVTCAFPAVIVLLTWWKRGRLDWKDIKPTLPFFAVGLAMATVTAVMEKVHVGAASQEWQFSAVERGLIAGRALWFYAAKLVWPVVLTFNYPRWTIDATIWWAYLFPAAFALLCLVLWHFTAKIGRGPLVAVLIFAGCLVPALGIFDIYPMIYSFVADHFQYLPSIALITLISALAAKATHLVAPHQKWLPGLLALLVLGSLGFLTHRQSRIYRNPETLWMDTIHKNPQSWLALLNLGGLRLDQGRLAEARDLLTGSLQIKEHNPLAHSNLGKLLYLQHDFDEAQRHFEMALDQKPDQGQIHNNLGCLYWSRKQWDKARMHLNRALELIPNFPDAHLNLAQLSAQMGHTEEAIKHMSAYLSLRPRDFARHLELVDLLVTARRYGEAVAHVQALIRVHPSNLAARRKAADVLEQAGDRDQALQVLGETLRMGAADRDVVPMIVAFLVDLPPGQDPAFLAEQATQICSGSPTRCAALFAALAGSLQERGRLAEADEVLRRASTPTK